MSVHSFRKVQFIPATPDRAWEFFSSPANLPLITPPEMDFQIISPYQGDRIYAGQLIEYKLRPLPGIRVYWMTEITHVMDRVYFVDEQRFGPYSLWHHQHHFKEVEGGVEMMDIVHYKVSFGFLGDLADHLFVKRQLEKIFTYRRLKVNEIFGG